MGAGLEWAGQPPPPPPIRYKEPTHSLKEVIEIAAGAASKAASHHRRYRAPPSRSRVAAAFHGLHYCATSARFVGSPAGCRQ